jgi:hypothetical protein
LRTDAKLFKKADELRWMGPTAAFAALTSKMGEPKLLERAKKLAVKIGEN